MLYNKNGEYKDIIEMYFVEGVINLCFGEPEPVAELYIDEAFDIKVKNKNKDEYVNIYIRHQSEGRNMTSDEKINHTVSVKVRAVNSQGREYGPTVPYIVPNGDKYKECVIASDKKEYERFDSKYGKVIRTFVNHSQDGINEYWNAKDTKELKEIQEKIEAKYNRHMKSKRKNK